MVTSIPPTSASVEEWMPHARTSDTAGSRDGEYRVLAFPSSHALTDDVIIADLHGQAYLLSQSSPVITPLNRDELDSLGMFFEPSVDFSRHSIRDLRRMIFGETEDIVL